MALQPWPDDETDRSGKGCVVAIGLSVAMWLAIGLLFLWAVKLWADTPIVYKSWSSQDCVEVDDPAGEASCTNLPDKYDLVWVE